MVWKHTYTVGPQLAGVSKSEGSSLFGLLRGVISGLQMLHV